MVYLSTILITLLLFFLELSFIPHFGLWMGIPFLLLPFISIISIKDRTIFPVILAAVAGLLVDSVSTVVVPVYAIAFISIALVSKIFLNRFISYGEFRANIINISIGLLIIFGTDIAFRINSISSYAWLWPFSFGIFLTFLTLAIYMYFGHNYFSWVEKETEERFR